MKLEYVSYLPGGWFSREDDGRGMFTRAVDVDCYALQASPGEEGSLLALWACASARLDEVRRAEGLLGDYSFRDVLVLGAEKMERKYVSALRWIKWWVDRVRVFQALERDLRAGPVSVFVNIPHGNALVSSLSWFVVSSGSVPSGLSYVLEDGAKDLAEAGDVDLKAMEALSLLKQGAVTLKSLAGVLNLEGEPPVVSGVALKGADGLRASERALLRDFRLRLSPYAADVPELSRRFLDVSDADLGVELANLCGDLFRKSFPDAFAASLDLEELAAAKVRKEKEARKKGGPAR